MDQAFGELCHYGIKGMKWGVRRTPEQLGHKIKSRIRPGDVVLEKGTKFQRIATTSNSGYTTGVYTSYKNADKDLYKGVLGRMRVTYLLKEHGDVKLSEITMTAGKDIRLPSKETRLAEFRKLSKSDPKGVSDLINDHETSRYNKKYKNYDQKYIEKNQQTVYQKFNDALALGTNSKYGNVIQKYYNNLSKQGYDAIPDENDIRLSTFKAQAPIIMFDTKKSIGKTTSRDLSASEVFSAYNRSIGKKTVRDMLYRGNIGFERLSPDSISKSKAYARQLKKDKYELSDKYTMKNLAEDWGKNRLTSSQIRKVSGKMDEGKTHDEAVAETIAIGNTAADFILSKFKI